MYIFAIDRLTDQRTTKTYYRPTHLKFRGNIFITTIGALRNDFTNSNFVDKFVQGFVSSRKTIICLFVYIW